MVEDRIVVDASDASFGKMAADEMGILANDGKQTRNLGIDFVYGKLLTKMSQTTGPTVRFRKFLTAKR